MTKVCSIEKGCGQEKDVSEFSKKGDGYRYICKECDKKYRKQYYLDNAEKVKEREKEYRLNNPEKIKEKNKQYCLNNLEKEKERKKRYRLNNPEKIKEIDKRYRLSNPEKTMLKNSIRRAKQKGLEHNITLEDIQIPEYCPVFTIKLEISEGRQSHNSPSLDRIDNNKGYIKGNVMVISYRANALKSDATIEEIEKLLAYMKLCRVQEEANNACSQQQA